MDFLTTEESIDTAMFPRKALETDYWHDIKIRLLLSRQGKAGLPIQNLHGSLLSAICGSYFVDADDQKEVLVLLVKAGANIHDKLYGMTVSDLACERRAAYVLVIGSQCSRDLRLRRIWSEALSACGYTEAAVSPVLETFREPEFDSPWLTSSGGFCDHSSCKAYERKQNVCLNVDLSDYEKQSTDNEIAQSDESSDITDSKLSAKASDNEEQSKNIKFVQRPACSFTTHYEQSILENGAKVWQDSRPRLHIRDVTWKLDMD